jgi:hypothetical protein
MNNEVSPLPQTMNTHMLIDEVIKTEEAYQVLSHTAEATKARERINALKTELAIRMERLTMPIRKHYEVSTQPNNQDRVTVITNQNHGGVYICREEDHVNGRGFDSVTVTVDPNNGTGIDVTTFTAEDGSLKAVITLPTVFGRQEE